MYKTVKDDTMTKHKKNKKLTPEQDKNNVAFYKKKIEHISIKASKEDLIEDKVASRNSSSRNSENEKQEIESITVPKHLSTPAKSWSQIAGENVKPVREIMSPQRKIIKIKPEFESDNTGYDRIVISPTHFNNKPFNGFIKDEEAETISKAIGLHELDNHHGTSFYRSEKDILFVTFKLKRNMTYLEILDSVHKYFWFDKESKTGNLDRISGQVVHPPMEEDNDDSSEEMDRSQSNPLTDSGNKDNSKEVRIDGCNYELSSLEITSWINQYGEVTSELEEIATTRESDGKIIGTGSYTLKMRLNRLIPNIIPMHGLKIKCSYQGVKKQCNRCYEYHGNKRGESKTCAKKSFEQYIETFREDNPKIPERMTSLADEDNIDQGDTYTNEEDTKSYEAETDNDIEEITNFNYNYSYDFVPNWLRDSECGSDPSVDEVF